MLETIYWCIEYGKVLLAFLFIMFVWPEVVFRRFLKGKSITFQFGFCATSMIVILNTVVLMAAICSILNVWAIRISFFGTFLAALWWNHPRDEMVAKRGRKLLKGTYSLKHMFLDIRLGVWAKGKKVIRQILEISRGHWMEYALLLVVLLFGAIYFTYGGFQQNSYGFGDLYVHNSWIYGLLEGKPFYGGVYPEGMHCFLYGIRVFFGVRLYSCLLFAGPIQSTLFLVAVYLFLKEIYSSRYTPVLVLAIFLTLDVKIEAVASMSRFQWTLPQEFGFPAIMICAVFLIRALKEEKAKKEDLLIFALALSATISTHFYATIMAFFICLACVPPFLRRVLQPKRFGALAAAVILGCVLSFVPIVGGLAIGIPFEKSINWATNIITGAEKESTSFVLESERGQENVSSGVVGNEAYWESVGGRPQTVPSTTVQKSLGERIRDKCIRSIQILYLGGFERFFESARAKLVVGTLGFVVLFWVVYRCVALFMRWFLKKHRDSGKHDLYISLCLALCLYITLFCADALGLPYLIERARICSLTQLLGIAVCAIPIDLVLTALGGLLSARAVSVLALLSVAGIYVGIRATGNFHGYLFLELTRYNGAVMTTYTITRDLPKESFTIVSTVDEIYQIIEYGYHEELVHFINQCVEAEYSLPTEYVFLYLEKHPIEYAQRHFFAGPSWLAEEKYYDYFKTGSQSPLINQSTISPELGYAPYYYYPLWSGSYKRLQSRTEIESRFSNWIEEFQRMYPNELKKYYEDENFACYYFRQNIACPYQLGFDLGGTVEDTRPQE